MDNQPGRKTKELRTSDARKANIVHESKRGNGTAESGRLVNEIVNHATNRRRVKLGRCAARIGIKVDK
jgi:hypothetical protein